MYVEWWSGIQLLHLPIAEDWECFIIARHIQKRPSKFHGNTAYPSQETDFERVGVS